MQARLILMLKYPRPGAVKTRLVLALGEAGACALYRSLVRQTLAEVRRIRDRIGVNVEARIAGAPGDNAVSDWFGSEISFRPQGRGDLGERMERAARDAFNEGAPAVVLIGGDCPQLTADRLEDAFRLLHPDEVTLGPAADGGYYLIGMKRFVPELFRGIEWGGDRVLEHTQSAARSLRLECRLLDTLHDVDEPADLPHWSKTPTAQAAGQGRISVIVPAHNEGPSLERTLAAVRRGHPHEILVVDGASTDETQVVARSQDAIVLSAPRCRSAQMNHGAEVATGEYLLFLHADTLLPDGYERHVQELLNTRDVIAGAFRFAIEGRFAGRRLVERVTNWRSRVRQLPYGDQTLFLRRQTFDSLGGFAGMPIMEDYELVYRLRRLGRIAIAPAEAVTAARRWQRLGWFRTTLLNQFIIAGYRVGVPPSRLAAWYRGR